MAISLNNLQQKQTLLRILVFTLVTVVIWVALTIFRSQQKTGISPELQKLAEPLNPNIDIQVIERIEQKKAYTESELQSFPILKIIRNKEGEDQIVGGSVPLPETSSSSSLLQLTAPAPSPSPSVTPSSSTSSVASGSATQNASASTQTTP
jgi:hypothetical protein